jgi:tRNA(Glu) U13 pseudouridine synthase TruD
MSLPKELCDNPKQIMGAGYKRQLRILAVREGKRPVSAAEIKGLIWRLQIPGAGDYRAIRALVEHLRKFGGANYFGPSVTGPDEAWSRWGKAVAHGRPLPAAAREVGCDIRKALRAYRADCANALIEQRLQEAVLATVLPGDVVRTHCQQSPSKQGLELVPLDDDISAWQARVDAREVQAQVLVPGRWPAAWTGLTAAAGEAAATQDRAWHERQLQRLDEFDAEWRDARFMPTGIKGDIERGDAIISCRLPVWVHIESVLAELLQREVAG